MAHTRLIDIGLMGRNPYVAILAACFAVGLSAAEHHGMVMSGGLPVPGATVMATQNEKKLITTTDEQGAYQFKDLPDGVWSIQVEMFGFATQSREVGIAPGAPSPEWQLHVLPLNAVRREPKPAVEEGPKAPASTPPQSAAAPVSRQGIARSGGPARAPTADGGVRPTGRQQNGFQQANVNASADPNALETETNAAGSAGGENAFADLNQSASGSLVVNGSLSGGLTLPQQNDWFAFGRGFPGGFGPGGPGGIETPGNFNLADGSGAQGGGLAQGGPGFGGPGGGGPGGRGGGFGGGFGGGGRGGFRGGRGGRGPGNVNAFGNRRRDRRRQYNGNIALILDNSALDARSYSLTGQ